MSETETPRAQQMAQAIASAMQTLTDANLIAVLHVTRPEDGGAQVAVSSWQPANPEHAALWAGMVFEQIADSMRQVCAAHGVQTEVSATRVPPNSGPQS